MEIGNVQNNENAYGMEVVILTVKNLNYRINIKVVVRQNVGLEVYSGTFNVDEAYKVEGNEVNDGTDNETKTFNDTS